MKRFGSLFLCALLLSLTVMACVPAAAPGTGESAAAPSAEVKDFVTWYQYDQGNEDPKSDERVGNHYLRDNSPLFNEAFKG